MLAHFLRWKKIGRSSTSSNLLCRQSALGRAHAQPTAVFTARTQSRCTLLQTGDAETALSATALLNTMAGRV